MDRDDWNTRYAGAELVWSAEPNRFVAEVVGPLPAGRALDLACGEGRNAIWMAGRGWDVTGLDFSDVGIAKAASLAEANGVTVTWVCGDATASAGGEQYDLVVVCYLHLVAEQMRVVLAGAAAALAPGGAVLVVGHALANLDGGVGGPQDPAVLYAPGDVVGWLPSLVVERAEHVTRLVGDGEAIDVLVVARRST